MVLLKNFCRSIPVSVTKAEPMSWFMDSPVTDYSSNFLNPTILASFFSVISAVKILFSSTGKSMLKICIGSIILTRFKDISDLDTYVGYNFLRLWGRFAQNFLGL